jgi:acyl-CoA thioester hydrolase
MRLIATDFTDTVIRVRYSETDQMGLAHHANYLVWFDVGSTEFCRHFGFEYERMEAEDDTFIVVAHASCRYRRPARFDNVLRIRTRAMGSQRRTVRFGYEILSETNQLIATGQTLHVFCNRLGHAKSLPEKYHAFSPPDSPPTQNRK